jgi:membrane-associated phospholipid phosphatase
MKIGISVLLVTFAIPALCQLQQPDAQPPQVQPAQNNGQNANAQNANAQQASPQQENTQQPPANRATSSALGVTPGTEALKNKDLYEASGYLHPFRRMPKFILTDQKRIWTSPFHTKKSDAKYWAIFGGATAGLIAADKYISHAVPRSASLTTLGDDVSYLGEAYTLIPISAGFYFYGAAKSDEHFREAGLLSFETLANVTVLELVLKSIADRERPLQGSTDGHFFSSQSARYDSSFPSGHSIETMALASVFAHEYHNKFWVKFLAYAYAGGVIGARLAANQHFPGDVMAGGSMGWFVGDYVYGKRHNPALDHNPSVTQRILNHVQIGGL